MKEKMKFDYIEIVYAAVVVLALSMLFIGFAAGISVGEKQAYGSIKADDECIQECAVECNSMQSVLGVD